jgi:hypothetical protein
MAGIEGEALDALEPAANYGSSFAPFPER